MMCNVSNLWLTTSLTSTIVFLESVSNISSKSSCQTQHRSESCVPRRSSSQLLVQTSYRSCSVGVCRTAFRHIQGRPADPAEDCLAYMHIVYMHHCILKKFVVHADSFQDKSADLQELFKLLEGTSHVEHQSVSRQAWR